MSWADPPRAPGAPGDPASHRGAFRLAMFPLGAVLFPHALLPLHVFESRYRTLAWQCAAEGANFGVVLIERGFEVGGGDSRFGVGTVAQVVRSAELPDGRWTLLALGARRIKIDRWLPEDPYPVAMVREWPDEPGEAHSAGALDAAERAVRRSLALAAEVGAQVLPASFSIAEEPSIACWQLCAAAPLGSLDKQALLEVPAAGARLATLTDLAEQAAEVLAYRLANG